MYMSLGAAHESSSSLLVFTWPEGFDSLEDLAAVVGIVFFETLPCGEEKFDKKAFEQAGADISVGLVIEFPAGIDSFDLRLERKAQYGLDVVQYEVAINILPTTIGSVSRKIGQFKVAFDDKEAGFDTPSEAVDFGEVDPAKALLVQQGGKQYFCFAGGQGNANEAIGNGSLRSDGNAHFEQCFSGFVLQALGDDGLSFTAFDKGFDGIAESDGDSDEAVGAEVLVQKGDDMAGKSTVVNHEHINGNFAKGFESHYGFGDLAGVKFDAGDDGVVQVVAHQQTGGGHLVVLVFMPAESIAQPGFIRKSKARAIGGPQPKALPALGPKGRIKRLVALGEHVLKELAQ